MEESKPFLEYVKIVEYDSDKAPACVHGPALLFDKVGNKFFACSACRDRKLCRLYIDFDDLKKSKYKTWPSLRDEVLPKQEHREVKFKVIDGQLLPEGTDVDQIFFCEVCCTLSEEMCPSDHNSQNLSSIDEIARPSEYLSQISHNKANAQYHFEEKTKKIIVDLAKAFDNVICIGTPSLFEILKQTTNCHLLDIDRRYEAFYSPKEFSWFNIFNKLLFRENNLFDNFLSSCKGSCLLLIDPPFGGLVGPMATTLRAIKDKLTGCDDIKQILVFPYFNEAQVKLHFPNLEMCDLLIKYRNHSKLSDKSPVRIFTDIPLKDIVLPDDEYKNCKVCNRWVHNNNEHCDVCETCPSKNAEKYRHCWACMRCVKDKYVHCEKCARCHLKDGCGKRRGGERENKLNKKSKK